MPLLQTYNSVRRSITWCLPRKVSYSTVQLQLMHITVHKGGGVQQRTLRSHLGLQEGLSTVLLMCLQLFEVDGVVAAVQVGELHEELVSRLQLCQGALIVCQLVGIPSRSVCLECDL